MEEKSNQLPRVRNLFKFASRKDQLLILSGTIGAVGMGVLQPLVYYAISSIYDGMSPETSPEEYLEKASEICFLMLWGGLLLIISGSVAMASWIWVGASQGFSYRREAYLELLRKDCKWFDSSDIPKIAPSLASDSIKVERASGDKMVAIISPFSVIVTAIALALYNDLRLTLYCMCFWVFIIAAMIFTKKGIEMKTRYSNLAYLKAAGVAEEALMEIKTVASLNAQKYVVKKYTESLKESEQYTVKTGLYIGLGMTVGFTLFMLQNAFLYYMGAISIRDEDENWIRGNQIGLVEIRTIVYASLMVCNNASNFLPALKILNEGRYAAARLLKIITEDHEVDHGDSKIAVDGELEFKNVSFYYPSCPDNKVLEIISFKVSPFSRIAIVGSSGSGKSTIAQLLLSLYSPSSGEILLSQIPLQSFDKKYLRQKIALVNQEPFLFDTSILNNILYGNLDASFKEVKDAAFKAGALEFVENLPDGFDTVVGSRGNELSGGQKQRIVIARAILRNPQILILDEATSALDRSAEAQITSTIEECLSECTRISIAQNLLTIKNSDLILVLENGSIKEQGKHRELMRNRGTYYSLYSLQKIQGKNDQGEEKGENSEMTFYNKNVEINEPQRVKNGEYIKKVLKLSKIQKLWLVMAIAGSLSIGITYPFIGTYTGLQINLLITERGDELVDTSLDYSVILTILAILIFIGFSFQSYGYPKTSSTVTEKLRRTSLSALLCFDSLFYANNHYSVLGSRLASDCEVINDIGGTFIGIVGAYLIGIIVSIGVATYFSWEIAFLILGVIPIVMCSIICGLFGTMKGLVNYSYEKSDKIAGDSILNYKTLKAMNLEPLFSDLYIQSTTEERKVNMKNTIRSAIGFGASLGIMYWYYALIFWFGAKMLDSDNVTFKNMVVSTQAALSTSDIFLLLIVFVGDIGGGFLAAKRVFSLLEYRPSIDVRSKDGIFTPIEGLIEFYNVTFAYPNREFPALKNVSFLVQPGSKLAVIGRSGSGKSTLASLLIRIYDPLQGSIIIDHTPIDKYNLKFLRNNIGIVIQEPILFSGTIKENILLGSKASEEDMQEAVDLSLVSQILEHSEEGLDRQVGFKGSKVSGGQKQRIAIARTLLRKPRIVVFDEATSALDSQTENIVLENIKNCFEGLTWIVIAHRLKTVKDADSVLVLDSGKVLEFGTQEELYEQRGYYYSVSKEPDQNL